MRLILASLVLMRSVSLVSKISTNLGSRSWSQLTSPEFSHSVRAMTTAGSADELGNKRFLGTIKNTQRSHIIDEVLIKSCCVSAQEILGMGDFAVDVWFCSEKKIIDLNGEWRGKRKSTDVLSFPVCDFLSPGLLDEADSALLFEKHLGDIVIAPAYVEKQLRRDQRLHSEGALDTSKDRGISLAMATEFDLQRRCELLVIHSLVHLVGYDHETYEEWELMTQKEEQVLAGIRHSARNQQE